MKHITWRDLPCIYMDSLNSVRMLGEQRPYTIGFYDLYAADPGPRHWHDALEVGCVLHGDGTLVLEDQEYRLQPGTVYVVNSAHRHMGYADGTMQLFVVHFHPYLLHDTSFHTLGVAATQPFAFGERRFLALLPASHPNTPQIVSLLTGIAGEYQAAAIGWEVVTKGYLLQIAGLLLRHFLSTTPPDPTVTRREALLARIAPALQLLEQNLVDPPSLADLAATIAVNPNYFCMLFREATGTSPVAYRNLRRVMCAQQLLANGDEPVSLIAERCGFEAVQQFNRVFLRLVGCTPGHYRHRTRDLSPS